MNINAEIYGHAVILNLRGDLTEDTLTGFKETADHHLAGKDVIDLILNMEKVPFVDSAALECLLDLQDRLAERLGQVRLVKCDENLRKILEITRLEAAFEVFEDVTLAIKATDV